MKKEDLPQDASALEGITRDLCYVKDADGKYTTDLSKGWDVKKQALDNAWDDINERVQEAAKTRRKEPYLLLHGKKINGFNFAFSLYRFLAIYH